MFRSSEQTFGSKQHQLFRAALGTQAMLLQGTSVAVKHSTLSVGRFSPTSTSSLTKQWIYITYHGTIITRAQRSEEANSVSVL
jgi:hypothetical protein